MADTREHELRKLIREFSAEAVSTNPIDLAKAIRESSLHGSASEMASLIALTIPHAGINHVPPALLEVVLHILANKRARIICDPCAGFGALIAAIQDTLHPEEALAFTPNHDDAVLGQTIVETVQWKVGDTLELLAAVDREFDVVASVLPFGLRSQRPLQAMTGADEKIEIQDEQGRLILVAASQKLATDGIGLFVVTPSFFFSAASVLRHFDALGLGVEVALALPSGTFAPYTNIETYLIIVRRRRFTKMFVAEVSTDSKTNVQIVENLKQGKEGGALELGRFVDSRSFFGLDLLRMFERLKQAKERFGFPATNLGHLATSIQLGDSGDKFEFLKQENSIFIPLVGQSDVVDSVDELTLKPQSYAQVVIDPSKSNARFVARFLNSELGREILDLNKTSGAVPKLTKKRLQNLQVLVADLQTQRGMIEIETRMASEETTLFGLQNEVNELRRTLWADPKSAPNVSQRLFALSSRLSVSLKGHTAERLDLWFETLPFPLATILRAWQATPSQDFKTKYEHLLHFFEATAEFMSIILLSAFSANEALFEPHKQKLKEAMQKQKLSFQQATFGTWKMVVEYLGKQIRQLLSDSGKKPDDAKNDRAVCANIFSDSSLALAEALSRKEYAGILSTTNKMRNDWTGHTGVVGQVEAELRNEQLIAELEKLRDAMADMWTNTELIHALHCRPRKGVFENEVAILMGSNSEFLKENRPMSMWLDVEQLYVSRKEGASALRLLPLVRVGLSPQSAKNACYFFNKVERDGIKFVSYHYIERPELKGQFEDAVDAMKLLSDQ